VCRVVCSIYRMRSVRMRLLTPRSPADVLKTRVMNANPKEGIMYRGAVDCAVKTFKNEGLKAFYKGWIPFFVRCGCGGRGGGLMRVRLGPHTVLTFVFAEQLTKMLRSLA
jgi:hypothetical protein